MEINRGETIVRVSPLRLACTYFVIGILVAFAIAVICAFQESLAADRRDAFSAALAVGLVATIGFTFLATLLAEIFADPREDGSSKWVLGWGAIMGMFVVFLVVFVLWMVLRI